MTETKTNETPKAQAATTEAAKPAETAPAAAKAATAAPVAAAKAAPAVAKAAAKPARRASAKAKARTTRAAKANAAIARKGAAVARKANQDIQNEVKEGTRIMKKEANQFADRAQAVFGDVNARAKSAIERNTRVAEEMTELGKGNVEAFVASTKIAAKGVEKIGQEVAEFSRKSFEDASAAIRSFADIKSPADLFRLQGEFARTQFDSMIAESSKMSEAVIKLAGDVMEPLSSRASLAAERVKTAVAL